MTRNSITFWLMFSICGHFSHLADCGKRDDKVQMFDFTNLDSVDDWQEVSDVVRSTGMSKAQLTLYKTKAFQRAILFMLINPQTNGAGFAGMAKLGFLKDLKDYDGIEVKCRSQGRYNEYRMILKHKGDNDEPYISYEQNFEGPKRKNFSVVRVPFDGFKAYYRGKLSNTTEKLDRSFVTGFGIQFHGGSCDSISQAGPASLEMDWIRPYKIG